MGLIETAQAAIKRIRTDPNGFTKSIAFTATTGETATIFGMYSKVHMGLDNEGNTISTKKAHVSISESALTDLGYPTRDTNNLCSLKGHRVLVTDSTGVVDEGIINEIYPDETVGLIVCKLGQYE